MILLDTHVVFWLALAPERLSSPARLAIQRERVHGQLAIAGRTLWEIASLIESGRVPVPRPLGEFLREVEFQFDVLALNAAIAERSVKFSANFPADPSDRVIAATALVHASTLVTRDRLIRASNEVPCIW